MFICFVPLFTSVHIDNGAGNERRLPELSLVYSMEAQGETASLVLFKLTSLKRLNTVPQQGHNVL